MKAMKRFSLGALVACTVGMLVVPAAAVAAIIELGATHTPLISYLCPSTIKPTDCTIVLTRATALETVRDNIGFPTKVSKAGQIVAFSVGLSRLSANASTAQSDIQYLNQAYGGATRVAITVLKQVGKKSQHRFQVVAASPMVKVQPYLGQVAQIPLQTTLPVKRGDVIALTTSTWAPVLVLNQSPTRFAYRQSRSANCANPPNSNQAQTKVNQSAPYKCEYPGTRAEYSATEVTNPSPTKPPLVRDIGG